MLDAAEEIMTEKGLDDSGIGEISKRIGVTDELTVT